ncbi:MAG TPA: methyltransferase domain-containing protein [Accumulibacter sp.]|uniref:methyltransferase domain-containing protein n=1 Tax=Accumulibacter sp. TaxID=2053492 RepID=UPI002BE480BA|nr:methyltransferase domain-containing protein [Accumulibacter sp.]HRD89088.1 methyltransferase domain-containing protein [Accumulibacter sp.]
MPAQLLRVLASSVLILGLAHPVHSARNYGDEQFRLEHGHDGKDVFWVPTPDAMVMLMLRTAKVTPADIVYDLGAGEGRIPIAAARAFGARAVGIEYSPEVAALARRNVKRAGLEGRVRIVTGDLFVEDFSEATVVTMFLTPVLNRRLRPLLLQMKPGTRIVSHGFHMGDWQPDATIATENAEGFFWIVPAQVAGEWSLRLPGDAAPARLRLQQAYQQVSGTLTSGERSVAVAGRLQGATLQFDYVRPDGTPATVGVAVDGQRLVGRQTHPQASGSVRGERC